MFNPLSVCSAFLTIRTALCCQTTNPILVYTTKFVVICSTKSFSWRYQGFKLELYTCKLHSLPLNYGRFLSPVSGTSFIHSPLPCTAVVTWVAQANLISSDTGFPYEHSFSRPSAPFISVLGMPEGRFSKLTST